MEIAGTRGSTHDEENGDPRFADYGIDPTLLEVESLEKDAAVLPDICGLNQGHELVSAHVTREAEQEQG